MKIKNYWQITLAAVAVYCPTMAWADVLPEVMPPPLETSLPLPRHIVIAGLAFSVVLVLVGIRLVRREKLNRLALNILLFLVGASTASLAFYANKIRADYAAEVYRVREANRNYRGGGRPEPDPELEPTVIGNDGSTPPEIDVPDIDVPDID